LGRGPDGRGEKLRKINREAGENSGTKEPDQR
jgi:hypothetical protein